MDFLDEELCVIKFNDKIPSTPMKEHIQSFENIKKCRYIIKDVDSMKTFYRCFINPITGVPIKDRTKGLLNFKSTFLGFISFLNF
jgi:hypothetical protein